ncbi:phosphatase PAP2 family protein [Rudanella paleaurantiibacter]|uniref:Phosphatase PAP2 family protein n=1 Tax=Rudanella paleaurantiibacter TaxID=2614655 RepID=A0A7J5U1A4_9BACT|nr:vanadium-dependent haloperoxidase [Rudanella paleaurantiibacter]KAB7731583.1 phosphatase PAP2 family protein [Rudanella paleaurantiibacter]
MKRFLMVCLLLSVWTGPVRAARPDLNARLQPTVFALTMVMIHDVVNPPAASRFYTYCLLGAHEIVAQHQPNGISPARLVRSFKPPTLDKSKPYDYQLAALYCMLETGRLILPSGYMLADEQTKFLAELKGHYPEAVVNGSVSVAQAVAKQVLAYAAVDNYSKLSARLRYRPTKTDGYWYPTPPGYMEAIEPHWRTIRPMLLDSCGQFKPKPPVAFSRDTTSAFHKLMQEVYQTTKSLTDEQRFIASYWDCNPFAINTSGHMSIGFKKISPGGHWMNIASLVSTKAQIPFDQAVMVQSVVAMTLMDSFISCWDEKYRSNRIRPETAINRYLNPRWQPLLQTPPFPEYTSGHSVISSAVAEVLSYLIGDQFSFTDTTETIFELPERNFTSFRQAAEEASISRLYGGIHYRDAIENGQEQGRAIGTFVVEKLRKAGVKPPVE